MAMTLLIDIPDEIAEELKTNSEEFRCSPEETVVDILKFYYKGPYNFKRVASQQERLLTSDLPPGNC